MGAEVVAIGADPNGLNINQNCGATSPEMLSKAVIEYKADLGIALDGDADRLIMVDALGKIYNGDQLLYLIAKDRLSYSHVAGVVGTVMTNMALEVALNNLKIDFSRASVGDRYVLEMLKEKGWLIGGESSGHIICLDKHTTGDGIISALQVLSALCRHKTTLSDFLSDLKLFPQTLVNVKVVPGFNWKENQEILKEKECVEKELGDRGRVLIRPSGTEPLIRFMVEAETISDAELFAHRLAAKCPGIVL